MDYKLLQKGGYYMIKNGLGCSYTSVFKFNYSRWHEDKFLVKINGSGWLTYSTLTKVICSNGNGWSSVSPYDVFKQISRKRYYNLVRIYDKTARDQTGRLDAVLT